MPPHEIEYSTALQLIWERSSYDRGYISNPFSGPDGPELGLQRTRALLDTLGAPDRSFPIVHVAGSKGKGSTSAYVAAIGQAAGYRSGLYTSPHLHSFRERIAIDGQSIGEATFAALTRQTIEAAERLESQQPELGQITAFELLTAMALLEFAQQACGLAVVEVGLGGTYDATNVVVPKVSVITRLDLEHTQVLGDTLADIAANKAGIIKPGVPAITAPQETSALRIIEVTAARRDAPLRVGGRDFHWSGDWRAFSWSDPDGEIADLRSGMAGDHQMENAALAVASWRALEGAGLSADPDAIRDGLRRAYLPGRFERVMVDGRTWVLDGAHTPVAARALANEIRAEFGGPVAAIVGFLQDKHPDPFLHALRPAVSQLIVTEPANPRALPADELIPIAQVGFSQATISQNLDTALLTARAATASEEPIVVTGSLALVAEARVLLGLAQSDPTPALDIPEKLRSIPIG